MNILFVHQNFPAQFKWLAPALARGHTVRILTHNRALPDSWRGLQVAHYPVQRGNTPGIHPWLVDLEAKIIRGEAAFHAAWQMKQDGFSPNVIVAHPGWGESLFLKDVWPNAQLGVYCEFFYHAYGADVGFDPEFSWNDPTIAAKLRIKNANTILHLDLAGGGIAPTQWQACTFPEPFRQKISVIHDGIDTDAVAPNMNIRLTLNSNRTLSKDDEVITFVNRNLEPYRGYHIFMRALPALLKKRPKAHILIVGGDGVSYGSQPSDQPSWKERFINEMRPQISDADWARVHFLGQLPYAHFIAVLQCSTVHVYLTYPFVLSWSLLEAMSVGCALVASDTQPVREAIFHNETGMLVNFFDHHALVESIEALLNDPAKRERLGNNARAYARARFDLKTVCLPQQLQWVESLAAETYR